VDNFIAKLQEEDCGEELQCDGADVHTFTVLAFDNYYTGNLTDEIGPMKRELDMPKFYPAFSDFSAAPNAATPNVVFPNNAANPYLTGRYYGELSAADRAVTQVYGERPEQRWPCGFGSQGRVRSSGKVADTGPSHLTGAARARRKWWGTVRGR
jgi:hypothetical protein